MLIVAASLLYMLQFVSRGWVPHDEGMIGQTAERVLAGQTPHIEFQEPYTGGLSWVHAGLFKLAGTDLLYARWLLFGGAVGAQVLLYALLRRHFRPVAASVGVWIALVWSFPNYFAAIPSWWLLICALSSLWALIRFHETQRLLFAALAGLAVGIAITIKQTGVYLSVPLLMSLWVASIFPRPGLPQHWQFVLRGITAASAVAFVVYLMRSRLDAANITYLVLPVFATCVGFVLWHRDEHNPGVPRVAVLLAAGIGMCLPLAIYVAPYVTSGQIGAFLYGAFVLPRERLQFASVPLPPATVMVTAIVMAGCLVPVSLRSRRSDSVLAAARWFIAFSVVIVSLKYFLVYQIVWQSTRSLAALVPIAASGIVLASGVSPKSPTGFSLFATASMLAWASLVQYPFGAPIYFCYVAPLAVVAGAAVLRHWWPAVRPFVGPWCALLLGFGLLSMNPSYPFTVGIFYKTAPVNIPLGLPKATLAVPESDATMYRHTVSLINENLGDGTLLAGPDCPEVYFLANQFSASGSIFDFFSGSSAGSGDFLDAAIRARDSVVVVNHRPGFTPALSQPTLLRLRSAFPQGETVGHFEVRWR
jgi:hypothetical protein